MKYTLRYLPGTPMNERKHRYAAPKYDTWVEAEDARLATPEPFGSQLEVVQR